MPASREWPGWTVTLHAALQPDQTSHHRPNGRYSFPGLTAGTYTLSTVAPAGWNLVTPAGGTLTEIVSAGGSVDNANFGYQIQPTIVGHNYAVLFSGGGDATKIYWYYNNIKSLYQELIAGLGLDPANIYVLYADGTDPAKDQNNSFIITDGLSNSDMSFVDSRLYCRGGDQEQPSGFTGPTCRRGPPSRQCPDRP